MSVQEYCPYDMKGKCILLKWVWLTESCYHPWFDLVMTSFPFCFFFSPFFFCVCGVVVTLCSSLWKKTCMEKCQYFLDFQMKEINWRRKKQEKKMLLPCCGRFWAVVIRFNLTKAPITGTSYRKNDTFQTSDFPISRWNFISWEATGVILEKRKMQKTFFFFVLVLSRVFFMYRNDILESGVQLFIDALGWVFPFPVLICLFSKAFLCAEKWYFGVSRLTSYWQAFL